MRSKLLTIFIFLLLSACSNDNTNPTYPFERTVSAVSATKTKACKDCYILRWLHPIEKKDLQNYYIWLDTTVVNDSVYSVSQAQISEASASVAYNGKGEGDSLDLTSLVGKFLNRDSLHIAIWAKYAGNEKGAVQHTYVHFGDDVPPSIVNFSDSAASKSIWINWTRPTDQKEFYSPEEISGPIAGYDISIEAIDKNENIRNATLRASLSEQLVNSSDIKRSYKFKKEGRGVVLEIDNNQSQNFLRFVLLDGKGFASDDIQANSWKMEISDLKPEQHYKVIIVAYDSAGNQSKPENRIVSTTDTIPPLIANKFWFYKDSGDGLPRLDSNRLVLFWPRSVDPLESPTPIQLDSTLRIPQGYQKYKEVRKYLIEQKNGENWESIVRDFVVLEDYYKARYRLENNSMKLDTASGGFISDTLRWVLPGDTITLRIRAVDNSGYYSKAWIETIVVSKGELWKYKCPQNFVPVKMDSSSVFCMEKLQHISRDKFEKNVLYEKAKKECESLSFRLCTELEWNAACTAGGSRYGVIEERNFSPDRFLYGYCGVGTGDSVSANSIAKRNRICASRNGVRDLPGQLQEWVTSKGDSGEVPLLKGSSYVIFEGASRVELAQCKNRFTPTRIRPKYTTDTVYLYRSGSRIDTLLSRDTLRTLHDILPPSKFEGTILIYSLADSAGNSLGTDYVDQEDYNKRGGDKYLDVIWQGLKYEGPIEKRQALILGKESINASKFFLDPTVGFRCCTDIKP
ncbi:MAG: hypothetical protein LBC87_03560 [Fibromonadaceae bacterium]|nr:hypothetical protein [Fibromonadaceae bacterium]